MKTFSTPYTYNEAGPYLTMIRTDEHWVGYFRVHRYKSGSEVRQCIAIVPLGIYKKLKLLTRFLPDKFEDLDKLPRQIFDLVYQGTAGQEGASDITFLSVAEMRNPKSGLCPLDHADAASVLIFTPAMARKRLPKADFDEGDEEWWRSYNSFKEWYKANQEED